MRTELRLKQPSDVCQACTNSTEFYERPVLGEAGVSRAELRTAAVRISENASGEFDAS